MHTQAQENHKLVLAFSPTSRGIGYAVFEGPQNPLDWGVKEARASKNAQCLKRVKEIIRFYGPDLIVIENEEKANRRGLRVHRLLKDIAVAAKQCNLTTYPISKVTIDGVFSQFQAHTKFQRAARIIEWLPELKLLTPRERKPWMSEDYRMGIFDAMTLALTYYYIED